MRLVSILEEAVRKFAQEKHDIQLEAIEIQATKKGFEGDITIVIFPLLRHIKAKPAKMALSAARENTLGVREIIQVQW